MSDPQSLARECHVFARYLTGHAAQDYVSRKYLEVFSSRVQATLAPCSRFDHILLALAGMHQLLTRMTDIHSRLFCPGSVVRRRLVMLLALLETDPASIARLDYPTCRGLAGFAWGMIVRGMASGLLLVPSLATLLPLQLLLGCCRLQRQVA